MDVMVMFLGVEESALNASRLDQSSCERGAESIVHSLVFVLVRRL
jgi:hypothetical protein